MTARGRGGSLLFRGRLEFHDDPGVGLGVDLRLEDGWLTVVTGNESLGTWSVDETTLTRIGGDKFTMTVQGEQLLFVADDPISLAYEGVPVMELARQRRRGLLRRIFGRRGQSRAPSGEDTTAVPEAPPEPAPDIFVALEPPSQLPEGAQPLPAGEYLASPPKPEDVVVDTTSGGVGAADPYAPMGPLEGSTIAEPASPGPEWAADPYAPAPPEGGPIPEPAPDPYSPSPPHEEAPSPEWGSDPYSAAPVEAPHHPQAAPSTPEWAPDPYTAPPREEPALAEAVTEAPEWAPDTAPDRAADPYASAAPEGTLTPEPTLPTLEWAGDAGTTTPAAEPGLREPAPSAPEWAGDPGTTTPVAEPALPEPAPSTPEWTADPYTAAVPADTSPGGVAHVGAPARDEDQEGRKAVLGLLDRVRRAAAAARNIPPPDHEHHYTEQQIAGGLIRRVCEECSHVSIGVDD